MLPDSMLHPTWVQEVRNFICAYMHKDPWHPADIHSFESDPICQPGQGFFRVGRDLSIKYQGIFPQRIHHYLCPQPETTVEH